MPQQVTVRFNSMCGGGPPEEFDHREVKEALTKAGFTQVDDYEWTKVTEATRRWLSNLRVFIYETDGLLPPEVESRRDYCSDCGSNIRIIVDDLPTPEVSSP